MIIDIEEVQLEIISDPLPSPSRHKTTYMSITYTTAVVAQCSVGINQNKIATYKLEFFLFIASECHYKI